MTLTWNHLEVKGVQVRAREDQLGMHLVRSELLLRTLLNYIHLLCFKPTQLPHSSIALYTCLPYCLFGEAKYASHGASDRLFHVYINASCLLLLCRFLQWLTSLLNHIQKFLPFAATVEIAHRTCLNISSCPAFGLPLTHIPSPAAQQG